MTNPKDATRTVVNNTTNELVMPSNVATVTATFKIIIDNITEGPEEYFLFLEGTRRVLILTPMVTVTILDMAGEFSAFSSYFVILNGVVAIITITHDSAVSS